MSILKLTDKEKKRIKAQHYALEKKEKEKKENLKNGVSLKKNK